MVIIKLIVALLERKHEGIDGEAGEGGPNPV